MSTGPSTVQNTGAAIAITTIDMAAFTDGTAADRSAAVEAVAEACTSTGFFGLLGHGVPPTILADTDRTARAFFALPYEEKLRWAERPGRYHGYFTRIRGLDPTAGSGPVRTDDAPPPDHYEGLGIGHPDEARTAALAPLPEEVSGFRSPNVWPDEPADLRAAWTRHYLAMEGLAETLLRVFSLALGLDEAWLGVAMGGHESVFACSHFPPLPDPLPHGQARLSAHGDFGTFTILWQPSTLPGLQVLQRGAWHEVPPVPGGFIVNVGDLLQRWTNDHWVSPVHRVDVPPVALRGTSRYSFPWFHGPTLSTVVSTVPTTITSSRPRRHEPIAVGAYLRAKVLERLELMARPRA